VTELETILVERINEKGPLPFAAFMQLALYHPKHGYYAHSPRTGWEGHFVTSPELDPAYGALWARAFEEVWTSLDRPAGFTIVEIGPGEGGFATAVLEAIDPDLRGALRYVLVERMPEARARQEAALGGRVGWVPSIVDLHEIPAGIAFANEVLDNVPVHLVEVRDGGLMEVCVGAEDGRLVEQLSPPSSPELAAFVDRTGVRLDEGTRYEVGLGAESLARRLAGIVRTGAVFFIDYGDDASALAQRAGGTLLTYGAAGVGVDPLAQPGTRDITAHANWTAIESSLAEAGMEVQGPIAQHRFLRDLGAEDLDRALRKEHDEALARKDGIGAVASLSRRQALRALLDPGGLGGLQVLIGTRGAAIDAVGRT